MTAMIRNPLREEEIESRWEAAPAVALVIAMQLLLASVSRSQDWKLWIFPWWVWLIPVAPEILLLLPLAWNRPRRRLEQLGHRRTVALALLAVVSLANAVLLLAVIASLVRGDEKRGAQLLLKAITVWTTNTIAFGLWYRAFDSGDPVRRLRPDPPPPDFQFPQMENPQLAAPGWRPQPSTTSTSPSPTRSPSAARTRCRSAAGRSCSCSPSPPSPRSRSCSSRRAR